MPVDLANVNISLRQFQKISSGTYNAGEIRITGRNSLGKVNNHVSRLGQNVVPLSHEEVMAVKTAFVKALASGGVGTDEIARVRRELGLAPDTGEAVDRNLGQRSMKPLTRQQVREILDRYAETINAHPGAPRIRTAAQRNARLTDAERTDRANRRDAVNNALDGSHAVSANNDILLFERLVAGHFNGIFREDAERMAEMARQKLASAREALAANPNPPAGRPLHVTWELPGGQTVDLLAPVGLADFVARLEDAIFLLSIERPRRGNAEPPPPPPPPVANAAWNAALKSALLSAPPKPLPHDIAVLEKTLVDEARAKFGADAIPPDARLATLVHGSTMLAFNQAVRDAGDRRVGPDDLRDRFRAALDTFGAATLAGRRLEQAAAALGVTGVTIADKRSFIARNPELMAAIARADSPEAVARTLDDAGPTIRKMAGLLAKIRELQRSVVDRAAEALARTCNLPKPVLAALPSVTKALVQKASTLGIKLAAGTEVACETEQDAERAFDDLVERFSEGLPAFLAKAEAVIAARGLSPIAADALRGLVCSLPSFKPEVFDPESVSAFADPLRRSLESLAVELREPGVSDDEGLAAVERFFDAGLAAFRTRMPQIVAPDEQVSAFQAFVLIAFDGKLDAVATIHDFLARPDVAKKLAMKPLASSLEGVFQWTKALGDPKAANGLLLEGLGTPKIPPFHAAALVGAARAAGLTATSEADVLALFAPDRPAGRLLAEAIRDFPLVVTPELLTGLVKSALAPFAGAIHDGVASAALAAPAADFPPAARSLAESAYQKAGAEPWKADALVAAAFRACGDDADVRAIVTANLDLFLVGANAALRTEEAVRQRVEALRANFAELRQLSANDPELFAQGRAMLVSLHGKALPPGLLPNLVQAAWELPADDLRGLSGRSRGMAIHRAVVRFVQNVDRAAEESGAMQQFEGADELAICRDFIVRRMLSNLRPADVQGLYAAFHSQNAVRLAHAYRRMENLAGDGLSDGLRSALGAVGQNLYQTILELRSTIGAHLGREDAPIGNLAGDPPRPETFGAAGLVNEVLPLARRRIADGRKAALDHYVKGGGAAAERLRGILSDRIGPEPDNPEQALYDDFQRITRTMLIRPMLTTLRRIASVPNGVPTLAPNRTFPIRLDGEEVSPDTLSALDHYAKFVTKGRKTTYASLTKAERNKAHFAMVFASKGTGELLAASFGILLDPRNNDPKARFEGDVVDQSFDLELDAAGNLRIVYSARQIPTNAVVGNERIPCGPGSEVRRTLEIHVNADDFERFASQDFTKYDDGPANRILNVQKPDNKHAQAYFAIPQPFRLRFDTVPGLVADLK